MPEEEAHPKVTAVYLHREEHGDGAEIRGLVGPSPHPPPQNCNSPRLSPLRASDDPHGDANAWAEADDEYQALA